MTQHADALWADWERTWQTAETATTPPADLRALTERESRAMRFRLVAEVIVTIATFALVGAVVARAGGVITSGWAIAAAVHTVAVWGFTLWNRAGTWGPLGHSTAEYLRLTRTRLERKRQSAAFTLWLVGAESMALVAAWIGLGWRVVWLPALGITGGAIVWAVRADRAARVGLERLAGIERELSDPV